MQSAAAPSQTTSSAGLVPFDLLPDALADALADVVAGCRREWQRESDRMAAEARATIAELRAEIADLRADAKGRIDAEVTRVAAAIAGIRNGEDADPEAVAAIAAERVAAGLPAQIAAGVEAIKQELAAIASSIDDRIEARVAALPPAEPGAPGAPGAPGEPGASVTIEDVAPLVRQEVERAVAALPPAEPGAPGAPGAPGEPGASVTIEDVAPLVRAAVAEAVAEISPPPAEPDRNGIRAIVGEEVARSIDALPRPVDGHTPTTEEMLPVVEEAVRRAVAGLPRPKDGDPGRDADPVDYEAIDQAIQKRVDERIAALPKPAETAGALIDRDGSLILTLDNGTLRNLGRVVGRDADPAEIERLAREAIERLPKPKDGVDGRDGFGFDDLTVEHDGERGLLLRFVRGEQVKEFPVKLAGVPLDRGVWREGTYEKGDAVTWGGSLFIAQRDTSDKPETSDAWRLAVKRGRPGKEGEPGKPGAPGAPGRPGRDLTQLGTDGRKW